MWKVTSHYSKQVTEPSPKLKSRKYIPNMKSKHNITKSNIFLKIKLGKLYPKFHRNKPVQTWHLYLEFVARTILLKLINKTTILMSWQLQGPREYFTNVLTFKTLKFSKKFQVIRKTHKGWMTLPPFEWPGFCPEPEQSTLYLMAQQAAWPSSSLLILLPSSSMEEMGGCRCPGRCDTAQKSWA